MLPCGQVHLRTGRDLMSGILCAPETVPSRRAMCGPLLLTGIFVLVTLVAMLVGPVEAFATAGDIYASGTYYRTTTYSGHSTMRGFGPALDLNVCTSSGSWVNDHRWPLHAPEDGSVSIYAYDNDGTGWGNSIIWTSSSGSEKLHIAHLDAFGRTGTVRAGDLIGYVGTTGYSSGDHVHISRQLKGSGVAVALSGRTLSAGVVYKSTGPVVSAPPNPTTPIISIAGSDRYSTAVDVSRAAFDSADSVIIATGANWSDALGGAALASAMQGPILLTGPDALPDVVLKEIRRLGASKAVILGGTDSVANTVQETLENELGEQNVSRIGGSDRYQTAEMIAEEAVSLLGGLYDGTCFVATGANFPDALAASPLSASQGWPLFLVPSSGLPSETESAMSRCGVDTAVVLGDTGVVPLAVETRLNVLFGDSNVNRLAGSNRYDTAVQIAEYGCRFTDLSWGGVALATGENFPDALAGGVLQGRSGGVLLLTPKTYLHSATRACLELHVNSITSLKYLGGTGAISTDVRTAISRVLK